MLTVSPDKQVRAYASLRALEARAQAFEELVATMKRRCLHGGAAAVDGVAESIDELRAHLVHLNAQTTELGTLLQGLTGQAPLPERRREPRAGSPGMRGTTDVLSVADLVGFLSSVKKTGTLTLQSPDSMFVFEFQGGAVVHAVTNVADPELRLGTILVAKNLLTEEQLMEQLAISSQSKELLGDQLVRSEAVSATDLRQALEVQVTRIFEAAFQLQDARFTFDEGNLSNIGQRIHLNTMHLLLEAARQTDEKQRRAQVAATRSALDSILPG